MSDVPPVVKRIERVWQLVAAGALLAGLAMGSARPGSPLWGTGLLLIGLLGGFVFGFVRGGKPRHG